MFSVLKFSLCQNTWVTILCCCLFQIYNVYYAMSHVGRNIEVLFEEDCYLLLMKVRF